MTFLLRGRVIFCCHVNRFLTVSLLSEIFTQQNSNFQGENCPNKFNFWPKLPPPPPPPGILEGFEVMESAVNMRYIKKQVTVEVPPWMRTYLSSHLWRLKKVEFIELTSIKYCFFSWRIWVYPLKNFVEIKASPLKNSIFIFSTPQEIFITYHWRIPWFLNQGWGAVLPLLAGSCCHINVQ